MSTLRFTALPPWSERPGGSPRFIIYRFVGHSKNIKIAISKTFYILVSTEVDNVSLKFIYKR